MNKAVVSIIVGTTFLLAGIVVLSSSQAKKTGPQPVNRALTGQPAPDFTLPSTDGRTIHLADYRGKQNVLLYFHEGLSCEPCIRQVPELEKDLPDLQTLNVVPFSIAFDSTQDLKQAMDRVGATAIPSLSYAAAQTEVDYDLTKNSMAIGRRAGHTFVLVDKTGVIQWRKDYWTGYGMTVTDGGTMFVTADEILTNVKKVLGA